MNRPLHLLNLGVFSLGQVTATLGALASFPPDHLYLSLTRHVRGDWGAVSPADAALNDEALRLGNRLLSVYPRDPTAEPGEASDDDILWIITEADRSVTTLLLPEEY